MLWHLEDFFLNILYFPFISDFKIYIFILFSFQDLKFFKKKKDFEIYSQLWAREGCDACAHAYYGQPLFQS